MEVLGQFLFLYRSILFFTGINNEINLMNFHVYRTIEIGPLHLMNRKFTEDYQTLLCLKVYRELSIQ